MMSQGCVARSTFPMNIGSIDDEDLFSLDPTRNCHGQQSNDTTLVDLEYYSIPTPHCAYGRLTPTV
jgi:hypothetical protein